MPHCCASKAQTTNLGVDWVGLILLMVTWVFTDTNSRFDDDVDKGIQTPSNIVRDCTLAVETVQMMFISFCVVQ